MVNPRVSLEHAAEVAEFKSALPGALGKLSRESRIVEESRKLPSEFRGIAGAKQEAAITEHLDEGAEIGGDHRKASQHIFGHHQAENFPGQGRNDNDRRARERGIEFCSGKASRKTNVPSKGRVQREALQRSALRPIADDQEFELAVTREQDAHGLEQDTNALGTDQAALEGDNRRTRRRCRIPHRRGNEFQAVRDRGNSRKLDQSAEPPGGCDVA